MSLPRASLPTLFIALISLTCASPAAAHEFWIEPHEYQVVSGADVVADFRNGQEFAGPDFAWFDRQIARAEYYLGESQRAAPLTGRPGDAPAIRLTSERDGLLRLVYQSTQQVLRYTDPEKFEAFVAHKALDTNALPTIAYPMREGYTRFVKALIAVGNGAGQDHATGLETEFVALRNPYRDDMTAGLPVQLLYQGTPRPGAQIEVFEKSPDGTVQITLLQTDADGRATVPVKPGYSYLLDSVVLRPAAPALAAEKDLIWESLWAALTFAVPAQ